MMPISIELQIPRLPLWQGVRARPGEFRALPFSLGWKDEGFIGQTTAPEVVADVVEAYAGDEYGYITPPPGASDWADKLGDQQVSFIADRCRGIRSGSVLEIGAGSHYVAERLLGLLDPRDYTIVDPSVRHGNPRVQVISDYFPTNRLAGRRFDLILAFNSVEHVPDPLAFLRGVATALAPDGVAALCLPDIERQFATGDLNALLHEHFSYFTQRSFARLAAVAGLRIAYLTSADDTMWALAHPASPSTAQETPDGLLFEGAVTMHRAFVRASAGATEAAGSGAVAFHGATNGLNNFLYLSGLAGDPRVTVFDGDEGKAGRFLPTCPNPIRSSSAPEYARCGRIFVSALTYLEPIRQFACERHGLDRTAVVPLFGAAAA